MGDLEEQIRAWADATVAAAGDGPQGTGPDALVAPAPARSGPRRWVRPVLVAACALAVVGAVAAVATRRGSGDVRTGPAAPGTTEPVATTSVASGPAGFRTLHIGSAGDEPIGTIRAAYDDDQLAALWADLEGERTSAAPDGEPVGPAPAIDWGRQVVVSFTVADPLCPGTLAGFEPVRGRGTVNPVIEPAPGECAPGVIPRRYVAALDWDGDQPSIRVELTGDQAGGEAGHQLIVNRLRPDLLTVDLETDIGTIHAGDQMEITLVIQNATGRALELSGCGSPFTIGLRRGDQYFAPGQASCLEGFTIPTGMSVRPVTLFASRMGCTSDLTAPAVERCQADGSPVDLDAGEYEVVLESPDGFDAVPPRRTIEVVPRGS